MSPSLRVLALIFAVVATSSAFFSNKLNPGGAISSSMASDDLFKLASPVGSTQPLNLTARAQLDESNKWKPTLVLNVSWAHGSDGSLRRSNSYHIVVHSLAAPEETYCQPDKFAEKYAISGKETSFRMPAQTFDAPEMGAFKVKPGCSYKVTVFTAVHDAAGGATINYTVPDCVGTICSCRRFQHLPPPEVTSANQVTPRKLNLTWTFPATADANITHFNVLLAESQPGKQYYGHKAIKKTRFNEDNALKATRYNQAILLGFSLRPDMLYQVEVSVEDENRRCHGYPGLASVEVVPPINSVTGTSDRSELWVTVLPSVTFVLACCLALAMIWQRCCGWIRMKCVDRNIQPIQWQGIYKAVGPDVSRARTNFPSMQHSVIYVEKEIEEAKARGDADTLEVSYTRLELGREIGKGAFGRVFLARAESIAGQPGFMAVAVKKLKHKAKNDEVEEFLSEIAMLKQVGRHPNIVTLLGCVTLRQPYCMVMEYIPCGDLLQYLRQLRVEYERRTGAALPFSSTRSRPAPCSPRSPRSLRYVELALSCSDSDASYVQPDTRVGGGGGSGGRPSITETEWSHLSNDTTTSLTSSRHANSTSPPPQQHLEYILDPKELQNFAVQIARGMAHLERKQITHRDLAARNVLIDENKTLKISDFGLSRSGIYVNTKRKKVPLRWLSLEAMRDNLYSSKSDVWAFAIVLWEIGTLGGFPYPTIGDYDLLAYLLDGKRLDKPDNCSDELYSLMLVCWSHAADSRPTFADLVSHLDSVICRRRVYVDFDNLRPDYTFPPTEQMKTPTEETTTAMATADKVTTTTTTNGE